MTITLAVTARDESVKMEVMRKNGEVPAVVYGAKQEPISITLSEKEFEKVRKEAGESTIVELAGLEESVEVLIKSVDFHPVKQQVTHVDFYAFERGKDMTTAVALEFVGEAPVEESKAGSVTKVLHEIEVTCRPSSLPSHIDVDISSLVNVEDKIHISDLVAPEGVVFEGDPEDPVAVVSAAKQTTDDEDEASTEINMDAIEVEEKGKGESADTQEKSE
jgi:large subunit ribosomal protein L25